MPRPFRYLVPALVLLAAAGCASPAPPAAPPDPFPPRPEAIDLERLDPCELLTAEQLTPRGLATTEPRTGSPPVGGKPSRVCGWSSIRTTFGYSVQFIPEDAAGTVGAAGTTVGSIEGYGTVRVTERETTSPLCEIYVDVDEGQLIRTQTQVTGTNPDGSVPSIEETCREAETATADAIRTARSLTP